MVLSQFMSLEYRRIRAAVASGNEGKMDDGGVARVGRAIYPL